MDHVFRMARARWRIRGVPRRFDNEVFVGAIRVMFAIDGVKAARTRFSMQAYFWSENFMKLKLLDRKEQSRKIGVLLGLVGCVCGIMMTVSGGFVRSFAALVPLFVSAGR